MTDQVITASFVDVAISNNASSFSSSKRFDKSITVAQLKAKLELITGLSAQSTDVEVFSDENKFLFRLDKDDRMIGSYQLDNGMRLHVMGKNLQAQHDFQDVSQVEKYSMGDKDYDKRTDTVRSFLKKNKLKHFDPENITAKEIQKEEEALENKKTRERIKVNSRCEVLVPGQLARRGTVLFVGETEFKPGVWVGVEYDEPYGKHDGTLQGKTYFTCKPKYGAFVRPKHVETGDFPEIDIDDDDEM